jgi:hypothetical protein
MDHPRLLVLFPGPLQRRGQGGGGIEHRRA